MRDKPYHLYSDTFDQSPCPKLDSGDYLVYRREKVNALKTFESCCRDIKTEYYDAGFSVNHSQYCKSPYDVLFLWDDTTNDYLLKEEYLPFQAKIESVHQIKISFQSSSITVIIKYCPEKSNISHCNIIFNPQIGEFKTSDKKKLRAEIVIFLSNTFHKVEDSDLSSTP